MQMTNCPKCNSANIATDVDLEMAKGWTHSRVSKILEHGVFSAERVVCEIRASACTDCGYLELHLIQNIGTLKDLMRPRAGRTPTTPVTW